MACLNACKIVWSQSAIKHTNFQAWLIMQCLTPFFFFKFSYHWCQIAYIFRHICQIFFMWFWALFYDFSRFETYKSFKSTLSQAIFLTHIKHMGIRDVFTKFRLGISNCYICENSRNTKCPFCRREIHFLFSCPKYFDLQEYIPRKFYRVISHFRLCLLMSDNQFSHISTEHY